MFLSALARPRGEREAWLAENCRDDPGLRLDVEELLLQHDQLEGGTLGPRAEEDGTPVPASLGVYRILGVLGRGGMGMVFRAQRGAEAPIALKVLRSGLLSPGLLARFGRETEVLARLDHPGIARLLESGTFETPAGPRPYFAMELVEGEDLRSWAGRQHPLEERLELLARVCDAVEHAHAQGVVHRDLKPENVLVRPDGSPCVLDFGVARLAGSDRLALTVMTSTGVLVGTVRYMSPEQADSARGEVDARSDVYALGVVSHELLSGTMPYEVPADSLHRALVAVLTSPPRPLPQVEGPRGRALEAVLGCALAKSPDERYRSAAELAAEFRRVASGGRPRARKPRQPFPPASVLVPLLVLALTAVAVLLLPGGRERLRPFLPGIGGSESGVSRAIELLDAASVDIYGTPREVALVRRGLARCDSTVRVLALEPGHASGPALERLAWGMAMDAHLWLGDHGFDADEYEASIAAAESTVRLADSGAVGSAVAGLEEPALARLADTRSRSARSVMALTAAKLALLKQPWTQVQRALAWNAAAIARLDVQPPRGALVDSEAVARLDVTLRVLRNERGIMLVRAGALADSAPAVREGLRLLEQSLEAGQGASGVRQMAPVLLRAGYAWAELGRIERRPAALDSAIAYLALAVARSRSSTVGALEVQSRLMLAETRRWRARMRGTHADACRDLEAAIGPLERRLAEPPGALHPRYLALLRLRRAEIQLDLAAIDRSPALADSALAGLERVAPCFTPAADEVVCSDLEIGRARAHALLWAARGDPAMREAARRGFATAAELVPELEDPGRARRIRAGLEALRAEGRRAASGAF